jgi:hypothetical protein
MDKGYKDLEQRNLTQSRRPPKVKSSKSEIQAKYHISASVPLARFPQLKETIEKRKR